MPTATASPARTPVYPQAAPNPFQPGRGQTVSFHFPESGNYDVHILDIRGRKVRTLANTDVWDGRNDNGNVCESGVYLYQIESGSTRMNGTVVLIR
jgi:flagellar hook assembly protein FlgD